MLEKIIDIQKVGRFEKLHVEPGLQLAKTTLIYGENGWGKSTIADILRSFVSKRHEIVLGRQTLAAGDGQKVILLFSGSNKVVFQDKEWTGHTQQIAVFDQSFINENIYSGEIVTHDHMKRQYGLVIGANGMEILRSICDIEEKEKEIKSEIKQWESVIQRIATDAGMKLADFISLDALPNGDESIRNKQAELKWAMKSEEIQIAKLPEILTVPTTVSDLRATLELSLKEVAATAHEYLQKHISSHTVQDSGATMQHEEWLEAGISFLVGKCCPFCGQELRDRKLVDLYVNYFSTTFKKHAEEVRKRRLTLQRCKSHNFREIFQARMQANTVAIEKLSNLTNEEFVAEIDDTTLISDLEDAAGTLDCAFQKKQEDLVSSFDVSRCSDALDKWKISCEIIQGYNHSILEYRERIGAVRNAANNINAEKIASELRVLGARMKRHETEAAAAIDSYDRFCAKHDELKKLKENKRKELRNYSSQVTKQLGAKINMYLDRMGAGFEIKYDETSFRGSDPSIKYDLVINKTSISPKTSDLATPSFRNTLSTGDKSALALALFLATVETDPNLSEMIVVLDDPFASMDLFRRRFTANQIKILSTKATQVIVLSHDLGFLRLLWDGIDKSSLKSLAIQTGAPGVATLTCIDIEQKTTAREYTERDKVVQFLDATEGDPEEIRLLLRKVLENFYRKADPEHFDSNETLGGIIAKIKKMGEDYKFKDALNDLEDINSYSRTSHHAPIVGDASEPTTTEELRNYCRIVRDLTRGA